MACHKRASLFTSHSLHLMLIISKVQLVCLLIQALASCTIDGRSAYNYTPTQHASKGSEEVIVAHIRNEAATVHEGPIALYSNTIPAAPVQGEAMSCSLDLSNELMGGVKVACMQGPLDMKHCCPVLAAWMMAARAKVALHPLLAQQPWMPLLPDDSLVCVASLKAALAARGIDVPQPNTTCDVVTCFCGIQLSHLTFQSCPLPFSPNATSSYHAPITNSSYGNVSSQPVSPFNVQRSSYDAHAETDRTVIKAAGKGLPVEPSFMNETSSTSTANNNSTHAVPPSSGGNLHSPVGANSDHNISHSGLSDLLQRLAANCKDHSYIGCTRCLNTLTKEMRTGPGQELGVSNSSVKVRECEMIGLMWLLQLNKTSYIPTVSAVIRALFYSGAADSTDAHRPAAMPHPLDHVRCSPDTDNMPLALDYAELQLSTSSSTSHSLRLPEYTYYVVRILSLILIKGTARLFECFLI